MVGRGTRQQIFKAAVMASCIFIITRHFRGEQDADTDGDNIRIQEQQQPADSHKDSRPATGSNSEPFCGAYKSIYYIKIHKTGSSTFQNILYRIGLDHDMFFALFACPYGMTYPNPPKSKYLFANPTVNGFQEYHMLTDHTMFDPNVFKDYMAPPTFLITLLRHPLKQLKSTFGFWELPVKFGISGSDPLGEYLTSPEKYEKERPGFGCSPNSMMSQTRNAQAHHLGLTNQTTADDSEIQEFVNKIDEQLDLVLILERFEESLILLKRTLCLSFRDILHLNIFSTKFFNRKTYESDNTISLEASHRQWSKVDYALYDHFLSKLDERITREGQDFTDEVDQFGTFQLSAREFCQSSCSKLPNVRTLQPDKARVELKDRIKFPATRWSEAFSVTRADCLLMMFETLMYDEAIKARQWPEICSSAARRKASLPRVQPDYCNQSDPEIPYFPWKKIKDSSYFSKTACLKNF